MRTVAIIQARMGSTRLPGKVLLPIMGKPMLWHIVHRMQTARRIEAIVVATSTNPADNKIADFAGQHGLLCFRGSEHDVLDRYYQAAKEFRADSVVRITGDCPLVDPELVSCLIEMYEQGSYDHVGIAAGAGAIFMDGGRFPDGLDAECFRFAALERAWREATEAGDREHVTPYLWRVAGRFRTGLLKAERDYSHLRWTVDTEADLCLVRQVYEALYTEGRIFLMADVLSFLDNHPDLGTANEGLIGKEGYMQVWYPVIGSEGICE